MTLGNIGCRYEVTLPETTNLSQFKNEESSNHTVGKRDATGIMSEIDNNLPTVKIGGNLANVLHLNNNNLFIDPQYIRDSL